MADGVSLLKSKLEYYGRLASEERFRNECILFLQKMILQLQEGHNPITSFETDYNTMNVHCYGKECAEKIYTGGRTVRITFVDREGEYHARVGRIE